MEKAKVYFTKEITEESLIRIFESLHENLEGKVAVKISTGEHGNPNYLDPKLIRGLVQKLNGTIVECNTAYEGKRNRTEDHWKTIEEHGFTKIAPVDLMDEEGDMEIPVVGGKHLKGNYVGDHLKNYDSMLMLSHFKGHPMGGFGGALKNMSIGVASARGKSWIHSAGMKQSGFSPDTPQDDFLESMAEADRAVIDYMKGRILYINVINNLSVDCDCVATPEAPCMQDIGILASLDPVAIDQAGLDLIYQSTDSGRDHFVERVETRNGKHTIEYAEQLGLGTTEYELISIDE